MSFSRPIHWYHSHADPIWPDGTFKFPVPFIMANTFDFVKSIKSYICTVTLPANIPQPSNFHTRVIWYNLGIYLGRPASS